MSNNREISQLASVLKVKESSNFIGIATEGLQIIGIGTDSISLNGTNGTISATSFNGDVTGTITGTADNFTVTANNGTDETVFPVFVDGATGSQGAETDTDFSYNPSSGTLSATKFAGDGSLLTNIQGTGGGGVASTIAVSDESSDATCFPIFATSSTGNVNPKTGSNLTFNSSNGTLNATAFVGNGSGLTNLSIPGISTSGTSTFNNLSVTGVSTFGGAIDANGDLDVDGHTELDNLNVSGISTFNDAVTITKTSNALNVNVTTTNAALNIQRSGSTKASFTPEFGEFRIQTTGSEDLALQANAAGGTSGDIFVKSGSTKVITVKGTGNVGIGTDDPTEKLDVDGTVKATSFVGNGSGLTNLNVPGISTSGSSTFTNLNVTGVSTFGGTIDANGDLDVDGHTELDNVNVSGISTFAGNINANGNIVGDSATNITGIAGVTASTLTGTLQTAAQPNITSVGTLSSLVASTAKVSDLTDNRIVIAGASGELEDTSKLTFDGTTLAIVGDATFTGNVSIAGTLTKEDVTSIDSVGLITARTGVRINSGGLVISSGIATFTDNIIANGNIVGDNSTNITGINQVTATTFSGALSGNADTATTATNVTVTANNSTNETVYPVFVDGATGSQGAETDTGLSYNPSSGTLSATTFSGSGASLTNLPASTTITVADESSDSACFPVFTTAATGNQAPKTHASALFYNSTNGTLHATSFSGTLLTAAQTNITTIGTLVNLTVSGNITANGNIVGDNSTDISGIDQVTANTFSGALSGNATSATTATNVTVADESSDTTCFPLFATAATGDLAPKSGSNLTFNSSTGALTATDFNSASDENLKDNIRTIEDPLAKVTEIRGVNFDWKENQKPSVGVIAQEVEKVFPELVTSGEKKSVNYNGLIGLLIEVVKEQQVQINSLNERLSRLE